LSGELLERHQAVVVAVLLRKHALDVLSEKKKILLTFYWN
jgi:hypothetical protein